MSNSKDEKYTVGSLYAGVGGICRAFQKAGAQILWANEYDANACKTYRESFKDSLSEGTHELIEKDVHKLSPTATRAVDILTSGFPCQAFSVAGQRRGFDDVRGLHFFQTMKFLDVEKQNRPQAFLFENVKNLQSHDSGQTFKRIQQEISKRNYSFVSLVLNTMKYGGVPQTRERIYMIGFRDEAGWVEGDNSKTAFFYENQPKEKKLIKTVGDLLEKNVDEKYYYNRFSCYKELKKQILNPKTIYQWRRVYVRENKSNVCPTLTANMGTGGHNVPLVLDSKGIRKLTPRECAKFQGFKDSELKFPIGMSDSHCYKQVGNSVSVPVVYEIARAIIGALNYKKLPQKTRVVAKTREALIS